MDTILKRQGLLFIFVGTINASFGYSVYALFIYFKFHYAIAAFISTLLGIIFSFNTTGRVVFSNFHMNLFVKYLGVYGFLYCFNVAILKILHIFINNDYLIGFIAILPWGITAFILNKYVVFKIIPTDKNR